MGSDKNRKVHSYRVGLMRIQGGPQKEWILFITPQHNLLSKTCCKTSTMKTVSPHFVTLKLPKPKHYAEHQNTASPQYYCWEGESYLPYKQLNTFGSKSW